MAAVGCLEKEIQFQKEAIKEQDARQAQDMPLTKKYPHPAKNIPFFCHPPGTDTPVCRCRMSHRGHPLLAWLRIPAPPGYPLPSEGSIGHPCRLLMPCRGPAAVVPPRFRPIRPSCRPGKRWAASPLSRSRDKNPSRKPKTETCRPLRKKVLRGEGARGRGTLFQKRPPPPAPPQASTSKN